MLLHDPLVNLKAIMFETLTCNLQLKKQNNNCINNNSSTMIKKNTQRIYQILILSQNPDNIEFIIKKNNDMFIIKCVNKI